MNYHGREHHTGRHGAVEVSQSSTSGSAGSFEGPWDELAAAFETSKPTP